MFFYERVTPASLTGYWCPPVFFKNPKGDAGKNEKIITKTEEFYDDITGGLFRKVITTITGGKKITEEYNGENKLTKRTEEV
jgi:hypothetical protein